MKTFKKTLVDFGRLCVDEWYSEKNEYDFNKPGYQEGTKDFTQMIWKSTTLIGSGIAVGNENVYCVSHYTPRGNIVDMFSDNVLPSQLK
jgi:glioma pathogenesis-related protein 2